jgi:NADPH2:quinone reductase
MKAAVVTRAGEAPNFTDFEDPVAAPGEVLVTVRAAAISQLVRARASGAHYSFDGRFPFVPGVDGIGVLPSGERVYFAFPTAPFGAMAEQVPVRAEQCVPIPAGLEDGRAAALANPGMSSWSALRDRAGIRAGETVLINGATGCSGRLAVQIARHLGAGRVIATGRNETVLEHLKALGADEIIPLNDAEGLPARLRASFAEGVDIVLDYLWGPSARAILDAACHAAPAERRRRFVQIGALTGAEIALPGAWLRSSALDLMGSGLGSVPMPRLIAAVGEMLAVADRIGLQIEAETLPLAEVSRAWADTTASARQVLRIG